MKIKNTLLLGTALIGLGALVTMAQDQGEGGGRRSGPPGFGGGGPRMASPVIAALDANSDGEIDANEIANASAALKKLDKNGDGKLSGDEIRPQRPAGGPPGGDRPPGGGGADRPRRPSDQ